MVTAAQGTVHVAAPAAHGALIDRAGVAATTGYLGGVGEALKDLVELNAKLESKVNLRTEDLVAANAKLKSNLGELHQMQRQLIEASRKAGMADVATSVLHNVGNVLNSVNVSASIVTDTVRGSKSMCMS